MCVYIHTYVYICVYVYVCVCVCREIRLALKTSNKENLLKLNETMVVPMVVPVLINACEIWLLIKHYGRNGAAGKQFLRLLSSYRTIDK
jgi:hypothetical protein